MGLFDLQKGAAAMASVGLGPPVYIDPNFLNNQIQGYEDSNTVVTNVFGDGLPTYDPGSNSYTVPDPSAAYNRFDQLNPPYTPPYVNIPTPNLSGLGGFFKNAGALIVVAILAILLIRR